MKVQRWGMIVDTKMDSRIGNNINGPSLIKVPTWIEGRLGNYYLYFAHHHGTYIRMAYADLIQGPWRIYGPGVLNLHSSGFNEHIASPDVHVIPEERQIRMYYHGGYKGTSNQVSRVSVSSDGRTFTARTAELGDPYFRAFQWKASWYAVAALGRLLRSESGVDRFRAGHRLFDEVIRHAAVWRSEEDLFVFFTQCGDAPERILASKINLADDWTRWKSTAPIEVIEPFMDYEGVNYPLLPSTRGAIYDPVRQLRDPAVYSEGGVLYLIYSVAGERGLALASISLDELLEASFPSKE